MSNHVFGYILLFLLGGSFMYPVEWIWRLLTRDRRPVAATAASKRPTVVHWDQQGRLHHPHEPAVVFQDGFSAFAWHGTRVPESWIRTPEALGVGEALTWPDPAQRRAAQQIIGWKRILEAVDVRTIDADADPTIGELIEAVLPEEMSARFLKVRCGTGRDFVLAVPPSMRTARQANAWTYRLSSDQYQPEVRT